MNAVVLNSANIGDNSRNGWNYWTQIYTLCKEHILNEMTQKGGI